MKKNAGFGAKGGGNMTIRILQITDYGAAYALWRGCTGMGLNSVDDSRAGIARFLYRNPGTCFAAEDGGRIVGVILAGHDGRRGHIYHLAVLQDSRRRGVGAQLVEAAIAALAAQGIAKVSLVTFARNAEGNAFWARMGFGAREDLCYRDRAILAAERTDT